MAGNRLGFVISARIAAEGVQKGAAQVKVALRSIQMHAMSMAAALGAGVYGFGSLIRSMTETARETNRVRIALKNVSGGVTEFANNLKYVTKLSSTYGQEINTVTGAFAKFTAAATASGVAMSDQRNIFDSITRSISAFGLGGQEANLTFLAISQMMSKGKISAEELRRQLGERMPIAMEAMARAAGVPIEGLDKLLQKGALLSKDVLPRFAEELEKLTPNVDVDHLETSFSRLKSSFVELTEAWDIGGKLKAVVDGVRRMLDALRTDVSTVVAIIGAALSGKIFSRLAAAKQAYAAQAASSNTAIARYETQLIKLKETLLAREQQLTAATLTGSQTKIAAAQKHVASVQASIAQVESAAARARTAHAAAASGSASMWGAAFASIKAGAISLKATLIASLPMLALSLLIGGVIKLVSWLSNAHKEAQKLKNEVRDYKAEMAKVDGGAEAARLRSLRDSLTKVKAGSEEWKALVDQIKGLLGDTLQLTGDHVKDNLLIEQSLTRQIELLKDKARQDALLSRNAEAEQTIREIETKYGFDIDSAMAAYNEAKAREAEIERKNADLKKRSRNKYSNRNMSYDIYRLGDGDRKAINFVEKMPGVSGDDRKRLAYAIRELDRTSADLNSDNMRRIEELQKQAAAEGVENKEVAKIKAEYKDTLAKLAKQQEAGLNVEKEIQQANEKYVKDLSAELGADAKKEEGFSSAMANMPSRSERAKKDDPLTKAEKRYVEEIGKLNNRLTAGVITQEQFTSEASRVAQAYREEAAGILGNRAESNRYFQESARFIQTGNEIQAEHDQSVVKLTRMREVGLLSESGYQDALEQLYQHTAEQILSKKQVTDAEQAYAKELTDAAKRIKTPAKREERDTTLDYKKSDKQKLQEERNLLKQYIGTLNEADDKLEGLQKELTDLDKALIVAEIREDIDKLNKEIRKGTYEGVKQVASAARHTTNAFRQMRKAFTDEDVSVFERLLNVFNAISQAVDGIMGVVETLKQLKETREQLTAATQASMAVDQAETAMKVENTATSIAADSAAATAAVTKGATEVAVNVAEGTSEATASAAKLPFPANLAAMAAAAAAAIAIFSNLPKFASGGIVGGNSWSGDRVPALLNSGEMILNVHDQNRLFKAIKSGRIGTAGEPTIIGGRIEIGLNKLAIALEKQDRRNKRT